MSTTVGRPAPSAPVSTVPTAPMPAPPSTAQPNSAPLASAPPSTAPAPPPALPHADRGLRPEHIQDAHRDVLLAVQRSLAANWDRDQPRVAVVERDGLVTAYVSTIRTIAPAVRSDIRGAVRAALAPYAPLAPYTNVVFLRRGMP